ncbi:cytochrome c oxidase subunit II [Maritimibacter dapengensis]|uniref:Cytochrome c oxidase subunit 2 n=1 Tax=Maritimibacter dapengensis TaxID=2836868 RepID=A0ABS6T0I5_9RHOB|nr:cytochrome c oxidase subunit II [Maritimibacter dapengensis]MBV7378744.1 cytochrome c oxidase subunit II [Maritimibacter dapengensis]
MKKTLRLLAPLAATFGASAALAQDLEVKGAPVPGGTGFQLAATDIAQATFALDDLLLYIIAAISIFVAALIVWVIIRYNRRANPNPSSFTHNTTVEIAWTFIPILILIFIGAQSLPVLFKQQEIPEGDVVIKVTGYQWFWGYEYVDEEFGFESFMLAEDELEEYGYDKSLWKLATDTAVVVPTGQKIVMQVTGADVIHSWTIPAFGVKQDAVPGRLAELWFTVEEGNEGIYFGQCSELCGKDHAYMPITVKAVTPAEYEAWLGEAREEYAGIPNTVKVAAAE